MKRIICAVLSLVFVFMFTACSKEKTSSDSGLDLEYFADLGKIPECDYTLGADINTVKDEVTENAQNESGENTFFDVSEENGMGCIQNGVYKFYYKTDNTEDGIACIASFDKAYDFEIGEVILTVKQALSGVEFTEEDITDDNAFFLFVPIEGSIIKCKFEKNTVVFVFENNALCATAIYRNDF